MLGMWLTTIGLFLGLLFFIVLVIYTLKLSVNASDAYRVDPLPKDVESTDQKK
ncbi:hypothetical protein PY093_04015 [Cytobacillus sp. S13-E01]|uniref:hypothetical protein n=1 Tax=Cytobacillus sp. S13-E01 TaxID=3031326 RepID=UPI0023D7E551|nr:hypothetical protein [Cytobacillus sp. S13-E01]MDF0725879.1 hypothetical protein [Cytobacillus sp. S13-E01]